MSALKIHASCLAIPYATGSLLDYIDLRGMSFLLIFASSWNLGEPTPVGYILLYVLSNIPPSNIMLFSRLISLFFCLLVGSIEMVLYVSCFLWNIPYLFM